ncbi:MAG: carboxypeptidase-like regulatory domain-containing protein, partial [Cyclobacteriaceae bacterium]
MKVIIPIPFRWKRILMLYCFMGLLHYSFGQDTKTISGTVTDNADESIPGVNVLVKGTAVGTITDIDGSYSVNVPDGSNTLVFSFIGYQTQEVTIGNSTQVDVSLEPSLSDMEEVVVIGYGEQSREVLTTSVSKMDERVLENIPFSNVASAMQGTLPGVRVQSTSGQPGA